ncbi:choline/ethanolamine kinase-like [Oppia nitens]|uniref:choline/ethanolamine kinase-like n=1 Tax=Oppia nitens TaxID=1686743 RepID=UPI0023DC3BE8|nr:choline/ethanolamine kinase-like [Oppia nitens]
MTTNLERRLSKELLESDVKILKKFKDVKSLEEFDLENLELIRGETPEDVKQRCLQLCKDYLSNEWLDQTVDTFEFKRLTGGMTNQLYYCSLPTVSNTSQTPQEVCIRFYGPKHFNEDERLSDIIIALLVSESHIGPKILGIFEDGQILQYLKHRQFRLPEQNNPKLAIQLFEMLAKIHSLEVPIKKSINWLFDYFDECLDIGYNKFSINQMFDELNCETLKKYDIKNEIQWIKKIMISINSPIVFTHVDCRGSNIMVTEPNDDIILCDFEYSNYGYRGFDLGTILIEWGHHFKDYNVSHNFPGDHVFEPLIKAYIDESVNIHGKAFLENKFNSYENLLKETKIFTLSAFMWLIMFCIKNDDNDDNALPINKNVMMGFAEVNYKSYWNFKNEFIKQHLFD